jgi:hypothetical protein
MKKVESKSAELVEADTIEILSRVHTITADSTAPRVVSLG